MRDLEQIQAQDSRQGFQFPGVFEITAMGNAAAALETRVPQILERIGLAVQAGSLRVRPSREGRYRAVTVGFACPSREKYNQAHAALREDPDIRWTL